MRKTVLCALLGLFVLAYVLPLGARPLFLPDEVRYAEIPREMLASGDWVVPHLDGLRYFEKPPLGYWLTAISLRVFGANPFAVRLPSALSAGGTALVLFLLVRAFGGGLAPAAASAAILLTSAMFYGIATFAVLDMQLTLFLTAAMASFFWAYREDDRRGKAMGLALFGLSCGTAFLIKGFLAFAVPAIVIAPFLVWERSTGGLLRLAWIPAVVVLAVAAPWAILMHLREPDFWSYFFWHEHVSRFLSQDAQHWEPVWYYAQFLIAGALPWTVLVPAAALGIGRKGFREPLLRYAACWLVFPLLFYSACKGKLGTYILPCFPPLALLVALGLWRYLAEGRQRAFAIGARLLALLLGAGVLALASWILSGRSPYTTGEAWKCAAGLGALATWVALTWLAAPRREPRVRITLLAAAPLLALTALPFLMPEAVELEHSPGTILVRNAARVEPGAPLFARSELVHSVCWYYGRSDVYILVPSGEVKYGLSFPDATARGMDRNEFLRFVSRYPSDTLITLVLTRGRYDDMKPTLRRPEFEDELGWFVFVQYRGKRARRTSPHFSPGS